MDPPAGAWTLAVSAKGYLPWRHAFHPASLPPAEGMTIVLEKGGAVITARVEDLAGRPVPGMVLFLRETRPGGGSRTARSDERGEVRFSGLGSAASYSIAFGLARPGGFYLSPAKPRKEVPDPPAFRDVRPGEGVRVFRLVPPAEVEGTVVMDGGKPQGKGLTLSFMGARERPLPPVFSVSRRLDEKGAFFFTGLSPGRYHLWMQGVTGGGSIKEPLEVVDLRQGERFGLSVMVPR